MNNASLVLLEKTRLKKLEDYKLDEKSILEFKGRVKQVDDETKNNLGKELLDLISSKRKTTQKDEEFTKKVLELIINGADIEYKDEKKGDFALLVSTRKGFIEIACLLLRAGANVNQVNNYLTTTLMAAARHGHKELLELLIILGANVNAKCLDGDNALMSAKRHNQQECFDILVRAQSSLTHRNVENQTINELEGNASLNPSYLIGANEIDDTPPTTEEDALNLIKEAEEQLHKLKNK
jgi:ankyrin repeat protein